MMMMIPSSSTFVDVHTDARRSTSSTSSTSSSSRRPSFVRRPSSPTTAGAHASHHTRPVPSRPRSVAAGGSNKAEERLRAQTPYFGPNFTHMSDPPHVYIMVREHTHTPHTVPVCVPTRGHIGRSPRPRDRRPDDPTTARARREDDDERRREARRTGDHVGRVTVRVTVHAQGARDDETRRTSDG